MSAALCHHLHVSHATAVCRGLPQLLLKLLNRPKLTAVNVLAGGPSGNRCVVLGPYIFHFFFFFGLLVFTLSPSLPGPIVAREALFSSPDPSTQRTICRAGNHA